MRRFVCGLVLLTASWASVTAASQAGAGLRIVVVEGEDAVNVIQQKTAVAPVIEVRDRNDQPVAGAIVNFAIRSGRATFGGARTLSVTTNAAGRAIAAGFTPTGSGALQISATAAFHGQTATAVTIAQTTVQTAAQAAAVTGAGSAGGTSGSASAGTSAGAGGGGGLSGTTIGIVSAAAAGGVVAATTMKESGNSSPTAKTYTGQFTGILPMTFLGNPPCTRDESHDGQIQIDVSDDGGAISGNGTVRSNVILSPGRCSPAAPVPETLGPISGTISGSDANLTFNGTQVNTLPPPNVRSYFITFTGARNGAEIQGTVTIRCEIGGAAGTQGNGTGSLTTNVTLR